LRGVPRADHTIARISFSGRDQYSDDIMHMEWRWSAFDFNQMLDLGMIYE
jgi:hypothetical protein